METKKAPSKMHRARTTVHHLTRQQMLENMVSYYLVDANPFAIDSLGKCRYFGDKQEKCGIGCQFEDGLASRIQAVFGSKSINKILKYPDISLAPALVLDKLNVSESVRNTISEHNADFATQLQSAHDEATKFTPDTTIEAFRERLIRSLAAIAARHGLKFQPVTDAAVA